MQKDEIGRGEGRWETGAQRQRVQARRVFNSENQYANTPHPNPLPYTTTASRPTRLPPRGEAGAGGRIDGQEGSENARQRVPTGGLTDGRGGTPPMFLRNEPILFSRTFPCITRILKNLCSLQRRLQMGSFWKTNPFQGGFCGVFIEK